MALGSSAAGFLDGSMTGSQAIEYPAIEYIERARELGPKLQAVRTVAAEAPRKVRRCIREGRAGS